MLRWQMIMTLGQSWLVGGEVFAFWREGFVVCVLANCRSLPVLNHSNQGAALTMRDLGVQPRTLSSFRVKWERCQVERQIARLEGCRMAGIQWMQQEKRCNQGTTYQGVECAYRDRRGIRPTGAAHRIHRKKCQSRDALALWYWCLIKDIAGAYILIGKYVKHMEV